MIKEWFHRKFDSQQQRYLALVIFLEIMAGTMICILIGVL